MINECWNPQSNHKDSYVVSNISSCEAPKCKFTPRLHYIGLFRGQKSTLFWGACPYTLSVVSTLWLGTLSHFNGRSAPASVPCYKTVIAYLLMHTWNLLFLW